MANLSTLRIATRRLLDETDSSNSNFDEPELTDYINQALRKTVTELEWPVAHATAVTVTAQSNYSLPANFLLLLNVFLNGQKLDFCDLEDLASIDPNYPNVTPDKPTTAYRADNDQIGLYPTPALAYAGQTILIEYVKFAADMSADADTPDLLSVIQDILPFWAANLAMVRAGNFKNADYFRGLYATELKSLKPKVIKFSEELLGLRWD